ncbi:MAG: tetratricopeptide repeat protein [Desulfomonile tiedjei]|nr:tetratricopeptide repeat protein [Desulfomonile tiedjei]
MKQTFSRQALVFCFVLSLSACCFLAPVYGQGQFPNAVKIVAPDGISAKVFSQPKVGSEVLDTAFNGVILEAVGPKEDFIEVRLPGKKVTGYVLKEHTKAWEAPPISGSSPILIAVAVIVIAALIGAGLFWLMKLKRTKEVAVHAASIPAAMKRAEEHFRAGDYGNAIKEFNNYLGLQGGEIRNPDIYRRLAVCHQQTNEIPEAIQCWEKMRALGGLKTTDDYALGVELMSAQGREAEAADIYEQILENEPDDGKRYEIHKRLFETYRRLKEPKRLVKHAVKLIPMGGDATQVISDTVNFLMSEGQSDLAINLDNKDLVKALCEEFVEDGVKTPEAGRIYLKCLEYDRTDQRLHKLLAEIYSEGGDYRRAVSELTILHQLDKDQSEIYMEQAARIYVENARVQDAIAEGNPLIIKKIAQIFLAHSEVHSDAVAVYEKVLEFQPRAIGVNKMLSTVYLTRGDLKKYMEKLRLLQEIDGVNQDYLTDLAQCIIDNDLIEQTIKEGNRELNAKMLKQLIKRGVSNDAAVSILERLVKHETENALIRGALARAYEQRGEYGKSVEHLVLMVKSKPDDEELIERTARIAVEHNFLEPVLQHGIGRLVSVTAEELVKAQADGTTCRQVLERARKEDPLNTPIRNYLDSIGSKPAPAGREYSPTAAKAQTQGASAGVLPSIVSSVASAPVKESTQPPSGQASRAQGWPQESPVAAKPTPAAKVSKPPAPTKPEASKPAQPEKPASAIPEESAKPTPQVQPQFISITAPTIPVAEKAITTFVSAHSQGSKLRYTREELFLPASGGLAYKDAEEVSSDGWGTVKVGAEVNTDRLVLIRIFKKGLLDSTAMKEFIEEVGDQSFSMAHESILALEEAVTGPTNEFGLIHPYLPKTLEQVVKANRPPDLGVRLRLMDQIIDGLAYAHNYKGRDGRLRKAFHLHLQPSVIFVSEDLTLCRISGLGYAQIYRNLTRAKRPRWEEPGMNPATMPPEFFRAKPATVPERASEVYSLGALIYFAATGEFPFEGPAFDDYKFQHTRVFAAPPRLINSAVPDWLEPIILGCLEKEPHKRWSTVAEIQQAFKRGLGSSK